MTAFSFEVPIAHLKDFEPYQDYHFLLSKLFQDRRYLDFYCDLSTTDHRQMWLDNSYNEELIADDPKELSNLMCLIGAHKLVVPDDPTWSTDKMVRSLLNTLQYISPREAITVSRTPSMTHELRRVGARHFALSYHVRLPHYDQGGSFEDLRWASNFHFLGLCSVRELLLLRPPTCETSMPIKLALLGKTMRDWHSEGSPHIHTRAIKDVYFSCQMTPSQLQLAFDNIKDLKEAVDEHSTTLLA